MENMLVAALAPLVFPERNRPIREHHVRNIAKEWDDDAVRAVVVFIRSYAANEMIVGDGQHTVLAAQKVGKTELPVEFRVVSSIEDEVDLWTKLNRKRIPVSTLDQYLQDLKRQEPYAIAIDAAAKRHNRLVKPRASGPNTIACIRMLKLLYERSPALFDKIFDLTAKFSVGEIFDGGIMRGFFHCERLLKNGDSLLSDMWSIRVLDLDYQQVKREISKTNGWAASGPTVDRRLAEIIRDLLNHGKQKRLSFGDE